ncbi:MAG: hypothetical protein PHV82_18715 [Victivallaceae bacterium]|nr:hypothetical protein [Victivallaceae bacterium]
MKTLLSFVVPVLFALVAVLMSGCYSTTTVMEFDKDGKLVKKTESTESPILSIEKSLKDKAVVVWGDGLSMSGSISPGTSENPTPHVEGKFRNGNGGFGTFPKDMAADKIQAIEGVIKATKTNASMGITSDGVAIKGQKTPEVINSSESPKKETSAASVAKE